MAGTPNGQKISITLEELGLQYEMTHIDISKGQQKEGWFLKINRMSGFRFFILRRNILGFWYRKRGGLGTEGNV